VWDVDEHGKLQQFRQFIDTVEFRDVVPDQAGE